MTDLPIEEFDYEYDVFVSYAAEDRHPFVRKLVAHLRSVGLRVWYDELHVRPGMSLYDILEDGISQSLIGIVVASTAYLEKRWTLHELEIFLKDGKNVIPIWHGLNESQLQSEIPNLEHIVGISSSIPVINIAEKVRELVCPAARSRVILCDGDTDAIVSKEYGVVFLMGDNVVTNTVSRKRVKEMEDRGRSGKIFEFSGRDITDQPMEGLFQFGEGIVGRSFQFHERMALIFSNHRLASDPDIERGIITEFVDDYGIQGPCRPIVAYRHFTFSIVDEVVMSLLEIE